MCSNIPDKRPFFMTVSKASKVQIGSKPGQARAYRIVSGTLPALLFVTLATLAVAPVAANVFQLPSAKTFERGAEMFNCASAPSVARAWNEQMLAAIRLDAPRPTVHARNLFHVSAAMFDAWAVYDARATAVLHDEPKLSGTESEQRTAVSHAAYGVLIHRFAASPGAPITLPALESCMLALGLDPGDEEMTGTTPAAVGNRVAQSVINYGLTDGANETGSYVDDGTYFPVNSPMLVQLPGTGGMVDPNTWQPLIPPGSFGVQSFLTPFWGQVTTFALVRPQPGEAYLDPGPPPMLGGPRDAELKQDILGLLRASASLDPDNGQWIDISPAVVGNNSLGTDDGNGYVANPVTGQPYPANPVLVGDFARASAEFWADGPQSSTPPGHWNEIANTVFDHPDFVRRIRGQGPELSRLEWDIKAYLTLNAALHDSAVATWEIKRRYDSSRPISLIREMANYGQSSDPDQGAYHPLGLPLEDGLVEVITADSSAPGQRHEHLIDHLGEIAVHSWLGHPADPETEYGGTGWMLAADWWPYQQQNFVTPPFPGYTSGHSGFSRAAAEVLAGITGSPWFPGGLAGYSVSADSTGYSLDFEYGPSQPVELQWVSYFDASDEAGQSRIWGGIHPAFDDYPGRIMGAEAGRSALDRALELFGSPAVAVPVPGPGRSMLVVLALLLAAGSCVQLRRSTPRPGRAMQTGKIMAS
jgi:hypothetical protein